MRIAYVKGLEALARSLEEYGHELVPIDTAKQCDAVLCIGHLPKVDPGPDGAIYLMASQKSPAQIQKALCKRLYSDLF